MRNKIQNSKFKIQKVDSFLSKVLREKKQELRIKNRNKNDLRFKIQDSQENIFMNAIKQSEPAIIGEIKFASPSGGILGSKNNLVKKVNEYKTANVDAISIITERKFFHGDPEFVRIVKKEASLPILQKDFVIDVSQIYESVNLGSDALLLIVRIISLRKLKQCVDLCLTLGVEPIVEIHSEEDLQKALQTKTRIIAVNARDLDTFKIDIQTACRLLKKIPAKYLRLGFSGVSGKKEFQQYVDSGASGVLIGTTLMRKEDTDEFISSLKTAH